MTKDCLLIDQHLKYIKHLDDAKNSFHTEHLKMSGIYWALTTTLLLHHPTLLNKEKILAFVVQCQHSSGGFGATPDRDPHLLYTLSALQILIMYNSINSIDVAKVIQYIVSLQNQETGAFRGSQPPDPVEYDTRFTYCALSALSLLGVLDRIDRVKALEWILKCQNFDGGFGSEPDAETHGAQVWTAVASLAILKRLDVLDADQLGSWLCERQLPCGGLNGRPEKLEDVCYSWWNLASLAIIDRLQWIDGDALRAFILSCQDADDGGFADRENNMSDIFHTLFGVAGLSLLGDKSVAQVNPVYCLPQTIVDSVLQ